MLYSLVFYVISHNEQVFGQVYDIEIPFRNGQSRGYGFVTFEKYVVE